MAGPEPGVLSSTSLHKASAKLLRPIVSFFAWLHIDPNWITGSSVVFASATGYALWQGKWWPAVLLLLANGVCDVVDGELARRLDAAGDRKFHLKEMGYILDGLTDRIADLLIFVGLIMRAVHLYSGDGIQERVLIFGLVLALGSHMISSYLRASLEKRGHYFPKKRRPLTRAGFHLAVIVVCMSTRYFPLPEPTVFFWTNLLIVCALTVGVLTVRIVAAYRIFSALR